MPYVESFREFAERQACPSIRLRDGRIVFRNGAQSNGMYHEDPPQKDSERLALRRQYAVARVEQSVSDFDQYQRHALQGHSIPWDQGRYGKPVSDDPVEMLEQLKSIVRVRQTHLILVNQLISELPENVEARKRQHIVKQIEQERTMKDAEQRRRIADITL